MRKLGLGVVLPGLLIFSLSCDSPTESRSNPYEQQPIDWPSLADSPWPMYRHDPQNTGRSEFPGAASGIILNKISQRNSQTSIVIGPDLTLYYFNQKPGEGYFLYAGDINGNIKWSKRVLRSDEPSTAPVVLYDGSIVAIGLEEGEYIRLGANGDTIWQCYSGNFSGLWASNAGIIVGLDTTIYFVDNTQTLRAISKNGTLEWSLSDSRFSSDCEYIPAFSPDGKTLYANGFQSTTLLAIDLENQSIKWTFGTIPLCNSPMVDNQGNIFLLNGKWQYSGEESDFAFYSLTPDGTVRWKYSLNDVDTYRIEPVIDWQGNIYFATDTLYSFTNDGKLRWKIVLGKQLLVPLVCNKENNIYFVTKDSNGMLAVFSINDDGKINWSIENTGEYIRLGSTPIIYNNFLIIPGWRSEWIYIIQ